MSDSPGLLTLAALIARYAGPQMVSSLGVPKALAGVVQLGGTDDERAVALANELESMGPTYVKLAQILASRPDLLSTPYRNALARLQDNVAAMPWSDVELTLTEELGDWDAHFATFERYPLAAASIGQVHRATLHTGEDVAVKVQRRGVREHMLSDLALWERIARIVEASSAAGAELRPVATLRQVRHAMLREFNYEREASNMERLNTVLDAHPLLFVPTPYRQHSSLCVLTMQFIAGQKLSEVPPTAATAPLADALFHAWMDQIAMGGFFHADPHPGNLMLAEDGRVAVLDCGMVGTVPRRLRRGLLKMLLALADSRVEDAADLFTRLSKDPDHADPEAFRTQVVETLGDAVESNLSELDVGNLLLQMQQAAVRHAIVVPPALTLIGKALLQLDEIGATINPNFRAADSIRKQATYLFQEMITQEATAPRALQALLESEDLMQALPESAARILATLADNRIRIQAITPGTEQLGAQLVQTGRTLGAAIVLGACVIGWAALAIAGAGWFALLLGLVLVIPTAASAGWLAMDVLRHDR